MVLPWPLLASSTTSKMAASATASATLPLNKRVGVTATTKLSSSAAVPGSSYSSRSRTPRSSRNVTASATLKEMETPPSSGSETEIDFLMDVPVKSRFTSGNFIKASQIIRSIKNPTPSPKDDRRPIFWSDEERILTYELTVAILKYSSFLREALEKSKFYVKFPSLQNIAQEELLVILYDLMERDFRVSQEDTPLPEGFARLQNAILETKTKLMAHIAKLRIKHEATAIENLLPTNLRQRQNIDKNPLYIWINLLKKSGLSKVVSALVSQAGLKETCFEDDTLIQENLFNVSKLHPNLIRMHSSKTPTITSLPIFKEGCIVVQDKSACLPVYVLVKALYFKEALNHRGVGLEQLNPFPNGGALKNQPPPVSELFQVLDSQSPRPSSSNATTSSSSATTAEESPEWYQGILDGAGKHFSKSDCVVITHCGTGRTAAHLATILSEAVPLYLSKSKNMTMTGSNLEKAIKSKFVYRPPLNVVVFGTPQNKYDEIHRYIRRTLGIQNIRLYSEDFLKVAPKDPRIKGCGAILVNPPSSGSALKDPVSYICSEGGDEQILRQFSKFVSNTASGASPSTIQDENGNPSSGTYSPLQASYLMKALSIPHVKLVLYTTCSNLSCENAEVVKACLNETRRKEETRKCQLFASIVLKSQSKQYRDVSFEVVNMTKLMEGYENDENCLSGDYVDMQPSSACSGVFMALIRRRDRLINMPKNPVKQFVANQMKEWSSGKGGDDEYDDLELDYFISPQLSGNASKVSLDSFTEDELARYLIRKLNLEKTGTSGGSGSKSVDFTNSLGPSVIPIFQANMKKKVSKKAIVKRVSTPTHSSLQRQTENFYPPGSARSEGRGSNPDSGSQTPRSGVRTPVMFMSGLGGGGGVDANPATSSSSARATGEGNSSGRIVHGCVACSHNAGCVCARHAKKFPDMVKNWLK